MSRRSTVVTVSLTATVTFLIGMIVAGTLVPSPAVSSAIDRSPLPLAESSSLAGSVNFADVAERLNPAVVNIDASSRRVDRRQSGDRLRPPDDEGLDEQDPRRPRRGAGTGFVIEPDGHILTNHHVIDGADRITVKLSDGRSLRARLVGSDPATDIALVKVEAGGALPVAPLGDSDRLRVGEWVCAIGNPLAYEHTVTVGVVSYIGRKLFDASLDRYIQTDAAINFGNSGGPLINAAGQVIGINSAISYKASNIGFAVPINQATLVLPQLKQNGRVRRGYLGVTLKDLDPDVRQSLNLDAVDGALVQDVTPDSPGERAGLRTYDLIVSVDDEPIASNDDLIWRIAAKMPGSVAALSFLRDGREHSVLIKLAERPDPAIRPDGDDSGRPAPSMNQSGATLGLSVRNLDARSTRRLRLPDDVTGVLVSRVEPMSAAADAGIERGVVVIEINRQVVGSTVDYHRLVTDATPGDVLLLYLYSPLTGERSLRTVRVEGR